MPSQYGRSLAVLRSVLNCSGRIRPIRAAANVQTTVRPRTYGSVGYGSSAALGQALCGQRAAVQCCRCWCARTALPLSVPITALSSPTKLALPASLPASASLASSVLQSFNRSVHTRSILSLTPLPHSSINSRPPISRHDKQQQHHTVEHSTFNAAHRGSAAHIPSAERDDAPQQRPSPRPRPLPVTPNTATPTPHIPSHRLSLSRTLSL